MRQNLIDIRNSAEPIDMEAVSREAGVHPLLNCPDVDAAHAMYKRIVEIRDEGDSSGGVCEVVATGIPAGVGEPMFDGLENRIAQAIFGIPAVRGIEFGAGFSCAGMRGSKHNDAFAADGGRVVTSTNNHGGILGGIS